MWRNFHKLPEYEATNQPEASPPSAPPADTLASVLALSSILNGDAQEAARALEPFMPDDSRVAVNTAMQTRESAAELERLARLRTGIEDRQPADIASMLSALAASGVVKDAEAASQMRDAAKQHRQMQQEIQRMQSLMEKLQSGDSSALMMELLGQMPGMENMGQMMNMMQMMNRAQQPDAQPGDA